MKEEQHNKCSLSRREWLRRAGMSAGALAAAALPLDAAENTKTSKLLEAFRKARPDGFPPVRTITRPPGHHWFGYFDKLQFDPTSRFVLGMRVDFEHRSPKADDVIQIGMVDLQDNDRWIELGHSCSWCWQQGCMLQWVPGSSSKVLWNDRQGDRFVCHILDINTREKHTIDTPIYALSPDGKTAVSLDFERIQTVRKGYGYPGIADRYVDELAPDGCGVYRVDLETGKRELIISIGRVANFGKIPNPDPQAKHYFNHLLVNTDGSRFIMLHRWRYPNGKRLTRMLTADMNGDDLWIVDDNGYTSHFVWRDPTYILSESSHPPYGHNLYLFQDRTHQVRIVEPEVFCQNGHCSYLPNREWILDDTYPDKQDRKQRPFLYHIKTKRIVPLGEFYSPPEYTGEWRCDTHPRTSPDGKLIAIDTPHNGQGRQLQLIDTSQIIS